MKSLIVFLRIIIVGILWGIVFTEGIRVIMLCNWHFDIFWPDHWRQAYELWKAGWTVHAPKEWAFVIILLTFFPMLITGWWTLSLVNWEYLIYKLITLPLSLYRRFIKAPINVITTHNKYGVTKRKSYKQIRPAGVVSGYRSPISDYGDSSAAPTYTPPVSLIPAPSTPSSSPAKTTKTDVSATIDHALFKFDDDDDDFDLDIDSFEKTDFTKKRETDSSRSNSSKTTPRFDFDDEETSRNNKRNDKNNRRDRRDEKSNKSERNSDKNYDQNNENNNGKSRGPVYDAVLQKGYQIISNVTVKSTTIDLIAVSENKIALCLIDKESGDWLADEELFNGEEPLWFSENSHRISPVRKLCVARDDIKEHLANTDFDLDISCFVIIQMANIINADDMFEIWNSLGIKVTRINRGTPKEIPLFSKTLEDQEAPMPKKEFDKLQKVIKAIK